MKVLNLIIKQKYFDEILAGTKTREYREVRPTTFKKYLRYTCCGQEFNDLEDIPKEEPYTTELNEVGFNVKVIPYDAIRLYVGYNKDRDDMLVEVKDIIHEYFVDAQGNRIEYTVGNDVYYASQMVYCLGKVLEKNVHPKKTK